MYDERIASYIASLNISERAVLEQIEQKARMDGVPIIREDMKNFIKVLFQMHRPESILEVGAAVGYSAIFMHEYQPEGGKITTIENYPPRILEAKKNISIAGCEDSITLLEGDAEILLPQLNETYDFIFMDAAKGQYLHFLPEVLRLLKQGGILLSDNVLQEGDIVQSRYGVIRRNRTIHTRMREYLHLLTHHPQLVTSVIPIGDGVALSIKAENDKE
ncbi:MAG: O-methyltransferase [Lachnospiraceae bacterium]